jgi:hypothetical protein
MPTLLQQWTLIRYLLEIPMNWFGIPELGKRLTACYSRDVQQIAV